MKTILVEEVYQLQGTSSETVVEDIPLKDVVSRFAVHPSLRGIFLVDSHQRFAGVITPADLLKWSTVILLRGKIGVLSNSEAHRIVFATKAMDLRRDNWMSVGVRETDTLQVALNQMIDNEEDIIPVLDSEGKILGDLRLGEVLLKAIEVSK
ncbi:CBS domain-containing protein [Chloroflexota bacterium]